VGCSGPIRCGSHLPQVVTICDPKTTPYCRGEHPHGGSFATLERAQLERAKASLQDTARNLCCPARVHSLAGGGGPRCLHAIFNRQLQVAA